MEKPAKAADADAQNVEARKTDISNPKCRLAITPTDNDDMFVDLSAFGLQPATEVDNSNFNSI